MNLIPAPLDRPAGAPWSFAYLAQHRPDDLAQRLQRCGLPPDWRPTYVGAVDYGPSPVPATYQEWAAWRDRRTAGVTTEPSTT